MRFGNSGGDAIGKKCLLMGSATYPVRMKSDERNLGEHKHKTILTSGRIVRTFRSRTHAC
jgi:hypothetical protein